MLFNTMPFAGPLAAVPEETLWNVNPLAPIVVLTTLRPMPVVELIVFPVPATLIVPPPVALRLRN